MALDNYGPAILVSTWGMFFITSVIVSLRVYIRYRNAIFGYDDWITLACWLVFLITAIITSLAVLGGLGQHIDSIPHVDWPRARRGQVISTASGILSFAFPKFGVMATMQRATNPPTKFWQRVFFMNWTLCTASFIFLLSVAVFQLVQCRPVAYQWELTPGTGSCIAPKVNIRLAYASSAFSTTLDFYFSMMPAFIIWRLQMTSKSRVMLIAVLGSSSSATLASLVKMWKLGNAISRSAEDPTYAMSELYILACLETTLLIVGSSLAPVLPLVRDMSSWLKSRSEESGTVENNGVSLRTFGQGAGERHRSLIENNETILGRGNASDDALWPCTEKLVDSTMIPRRFRLEGYV